MDGIDARSPGLVVGSWAGNKAALFFGIGLSVLTLDLVTKIMIQRSLERYQQVEVIGEYVRLTYIYNPGAAFGIHVGPHSRLVFLVLSALALAALLVMYWATPATNRIRLNSIALICGGALGNMVDRVRSPNGVVDFLDIGIGDVRWPVFNVADIAVTAGAIYLALSLWREDRDDDEGG